MIDWDRVHDLRTEIGQDDFGDVVTLFLEEADEVVARLANLEEAGSIERVLHFLKGSALNLGFSDLAQICQTGERSAAAGRTDIDLGKIVASYHASRRVFLTGLQSIVAA